MSKSKQKKFVMNANILRIILIVGLFANTILGAIGFTYGIDILKKQAMEVSHKKVDAVASNGAIQVLQSAQQKLDDNADVLEKIGLLRSNSQFPEFRVRDEVAAIASKNNITLEGFSYGGAGQDTATGSSSSPAATPTPPVPATPAAGGSTISITVTPKTTNYMDFLQFTYDIEQNLPKMKIQGISVKSGGDNGGVSVQPVVIEMYIR